MVDYKEMYLIMVRAAEKAIRMIEAGDSAKMAAIHLIRAQQLCEEMYISAEEH